MVDRRPLWDVLPLGSVCFACPEWVKEYEKISDSSYQKYFGLFNPDLFNLKDWAKMAKEAGMKYKTRPVAARCFGSYIWRTPSQRNLPQEVKMILS